MSTLSHSRPGLEGEAPPEPHPGTARTEPRPPGTPEAPRAVTFERDGVTQVVDSVSLDLLGGAEIDFVEELGGSYFQVRNPNAKSSCGCGNSFAI